MKLWSKLSSLGRKQKLDAEMAEEMRLHLELQTERNIAAGMDPHEARYAARRQFGGVEQIKERCRDQRGWVWLEQALVDVRYAVRQLRKTPGFTGVALLTLTLGIGACCAIFTVVNSVLLRPIDFPESERLVVLQGAHPQHSHTSVSPANFRLWLERADVFESLAVRSDYPGDLVEEGEPVRAQVAGVTGDFFKTLRVQPFLGRLTGAADETPKTSDVVVLTHEFWQRQFGGRPKIIGSTIRLGGGSFPIVTVVGILSPQFKSDGVDVYTPLWMPEEYWQSHGRMFKLVVGRLKPGATIEQARAQMDAIATLAAEQSPESNKDWGVSVTSLLDYETSRVRPTLYALLGAVSVLLLIAWTNFANLLLVRATIRQREIAVRAALGATRGRIARQLLTESLVLAFLGGAFGLLAARWGLSVLLQLVPGGLPRAGEIALDGWMVAVTTGVTLLLGVAFGLLPAWFGTRVDLGTALKGSSHNATDGRGPRLIRNGLVIVQIALALVLLTGAGLLIRSFVRLSEVHPGFQPANALMLWVYSGNRTPDTQRAFTDAGISRFRELPGVTSAGATVFIPFSGTSHSGAIGFEDEHVPYNERPPTVHFPVTPDYFQAMGIPLLRGRGFSDRDTADAPPVAMVSQKLVEKHFPGKDPIGKRIQVDWKNTWCEIIGVVGDVRHDGNRGEIVPQTYQPFAQAPSGVVTFVVRSEVSPATLAPLLRLALREIAPDVPVFRLERLEGLIADSMARERLAMIMIAVFSVVALTLSAAGIYGVMAYAVAQRTREFGIRLAIGAQARDLRRLVLGRGARLVVSGIVLGGLGASVTTKLIQALLYNTAARDPVIFAATAVIMSAVAFAACLVLARRAAKIDPLVALRCE